MNDILLAQLSARVMSGIRVCSSCATRALGGDAWYHVLYYLFDCLSLWSVACEHGGAIMKQLRSLEVDTHMLFQMLHDIFK